MNRRQRRKREHLDRTWPGISKASRSKRARGKTRIAILGPALNHRGRYPSTHRNRPTTSSLATQASRLPKLSSWPKEMR